MVNNLRTTNRVAPHPFRPLRWWDRLLQFGRCRHCYLPCFAHPVTCYVPARPLGDRSGAEVSWDSLHEGIDGSRIRD